MQHNKLIIAITGASGAIYGQRMLEILCSLKIETHLVISRSAALTIMQELEVSIKDLKSLADYTYNESEIGAKIASGSFRTDGMIIAPCSSKTLSAIAMGYENNLIVRAANVIIKEQKKLTLMVREVPLSPIHLENMLKLANYGVNISPPVPAFYNHPKSIDDMVNHSVQRVLDLYDIDSKLASRWQGIKG